LSPFRNASIESPESSEGVQKWMQA
jgi:hypothetical protein